jgi:hypothetical protein
MPQPEDACLAEIIARMPQPVQAAIQACLDELEPLDDQDRRTVVAALVLTIKLDLLDGARLN